MGEVVIHRVRSFRRAVDHSNAFEQAVFILTGFIGAYRLVRKRKPDMMLAFFGVPAGVSALLVKTLTGIPYCVSMRGGDVPGFRPYDFAVVHSLSAPLIRLVWKRAKALIANSQGLRGIALRFSPASSVHVIPNGVESSTYHPVERDWSKVKLLFAGRLVHQKGVDILIQALSKLQDLRWELDLVGDGPKSDEYARFVSEAGLADRVHFKGWLADEDLRKAYQEATHFILPSRHEGMPNVILEAMASGLPVIATRIAGSEELVLDGKTGYLVQMEDPQALAAAIRDLITSSGRSASFGKAGRERVVSQYSWEMVAKQYLQMMGLETG
jgi:glycosyltransferase involved in cell wall biosynthesis